MAYSITAKRASNPSLGIPSGRHVQTPGVRWTSVRFAIDLVPIRNATCATMVSYLTKSKVNAYYHVLSLIVRIVTLI